MDGQNLRDSLTDAIRYWEPLRLVYNAALAAVVLVCFWIGYPGSKESLAVDTFLFVFVMAVLANVAYCAAYVMDIVAQASGNRELWRKYRLAFLPSGCCCGNHNALLRYGTACIGIAIRLRGAHPC